MVASLTYRTNDVTRWGGGLMSDLSATQVDLNFWTLYSAVQALEDHADVAAGIDYINQPGGGNLFYVHLTNHAVLGPFTIPTAQWNPRGPWAPATVYAAFDVVTEDGAVYIVNVPATSGATFSPFATDGMGHNLYTLLLQQPADELPSGGVAGQKLLKSTDSPFSTEWADDTRVLSVFVEGMPSPSETLMQYLVPEHMTLPQGLVGSVFYQGIQTSTVVVYSLSKIDSGGVTAIGTVTFNISPEDIVVVFSTDVAFAPGDILTLTAPATPDAAQSNISFTFVATLTL